MRRPALLLAACAACAGPTEPTAPFDPAEPGPYTAAHTRRQLPPDPTGRALTVELWYPSEADPVAPRATAEAYAIDQDQALALQALLDAAPAGCPTRTSAAATDAPPAPDPRGAVVFSHCHECTRFSSFTLAAHLASHGLIVAAPDHDGNTLWDAGTDGALPITEATLRLRADDLGRVTDALLAGTLDLPAGLTIDPDRLGAMGHSFGSSSAALLAQSDPRVRASLGLAAPMDNPLAPGVDLTTLDIPLLWLLAREDNSITELGNLVMRNEFDAATGPAWKAEVDDAGHWSFSDLCGLVDAFQPGCGSAERQTAPSEPFTYLPVARGLSVANTLAAAFFGEQLLGHTDALANLTLDGVQLDAR